MPDEQQREGTPAVAPKNACPHPEAVGMRWGDPISEERQAELRAMHDAWNAPDAENGDRAGPFARVTLTGAEVAWLAHQAHMDTELSSWVNGLNLYGAVLREAHLEGADLFAARLERANLGGAYLERANLRAAHLEGSNLFAAHLGHANLGGAHLEGADLGTARLEGANLRAAHLEGKLYQANDADWLRLRKSVPNLLATLRPADLREAFLDEATTLRDAILCASGSANRPLGAGPRVADIRWGGVNLATLDWTPFSEGGALLGDERQARDWRAESYKESPTLKKEKRRLRVDARRKHAAQQHHEGLDRWAAAARANRQLATVLRAQGMSDEADHFAYRAQVCQRRLLLFRGKWWQALFSRFLDLLAGYGYKPGRTLATYVVVIALFAGLYLLTSYGMVGFGMPLIGVKPLLWYQAIILSVSAFHGRGFFQELPGDPVALCAAIEAICGLVIEVSFIATFTQRFFGGK